MICFESFLIAICEGDFHLFSNCFSDRFINEDYKHRLMTYGYIKAELSSKDGHKNLRPIHLACDRGNVEIIERMIMSKCNIEVTSKIGNRPLHIASSRGHWEVVAMLLRQNCDINAVNYKEETALHFAAKENHLKVTKILLFEGIDTTKTDSIKMTALQVGESNGSYSVTQCIREWLKFTRVLNDIHNGKFKAVLKHSGFKKFYISHDICIEAIIKYLKVTDRYKTVDLFVEDIRFYHYIRIHQKEDYIMHADIDAINKLFDQNGALVYCLSYDDICPYFCNNLLQLMLDMDQIEENIQRMLRIVEKYFNKNIIILIKKRQKFVAVKKKALWNRLHLAVSDDRCDMIEYLLKKAYVNMNDMDEIGNTPLFLACIYGHLECAKMLLSFGADVNTRNKYGQSLLQVALENGMEDFIIPILDQVSSIDSVDVLGHTILNVAIKFGSSELYDILVAKSKSVENEILNSPVLAYLSTERNQNILLSVSLKENTASLFLKVKGHIPQSLISAMSSTSLQIQDESHNSLLHLAAWNMSFETCEGLIKKGADVHLKNVHGNTPLHEVINRFIFDHPENIEECLLITVRILIQSGSDINAINSLGDSPLQISLQIFNKRLINEIILNSSNIVLNKIHLTLILGTQHLDFISEIVSKLTPECVTESLTKDFIENAIGKWDFSIIEILIDKTTLEIRKAILAKILFSGDNATDLFSSYIKYKEEILEILNGDTILTYYLKKGNITLCEKIISSKYANVQVNMKTSQSQTCLHISIQLGYFRLVEPILCILSHCDHKDNDGNTPLGVLVKKWSVEENSSDSPYMYYLIKVLIRNGANINSENRDGRSVVDECSNMKMKKKLNKLYKKRLLNKFIPLKK